MAHVCMDSLWSLRYTRVELLEQGIRLFSHNFHKSQEDRNKQIIFSVDYVSLYNFIRDILTGHKYLKICLFHKILSNFWQHWLYVIIYDLSEYM